VQLGEQVQQRLDPHHMSLSNKHGNCMFMIQTGQTKAKLAFNIINIITATNSSAISILYGVKFTLLPMIKGVAINKVLAIHYSL